VAREQRGKLFQPRRPGEIFNSVFFVTVANH
jgi:hypothetical protein